MDVERAGPVLHNYPLKRYLSDRARGKQRRYLFFIYVVDHTLTVADTNVVQVVDVDTDAPFLWVKTYGEATDGNSNNQRQRPNVLVQVRIGGPGARSLSRDPVPWSNCAAYRPKGHTLPCPELVPRGSQFHVTLKAPSTATVEAFPFNTELQFVGYKIYGWGP